MSNALPQLVADRYRLISPLGQGGMGRVWKARDEVLHRDVAIKELVPPPSLTPEERREMRERSLREARAIARLNNVNVVRIFDVLRTDGDPWIVMEYVPSKSLQDTIAEDGPVSPAKAVEIGLGVLGALKAAHKAGIMHRDVKPGNVLLGNDGRVVLTDFGLATIPGDPNVTRTGMVLGSPAYIAPERARDGTAGPEADLWSLGATLYAALEGKSPYARPSAIATLAALATEPLPPPKNAGPLKPVLQGLLRKDPEERITAEVAERMLRKAAGRRAKSISLLDGVRRPGPNGPREPRPPLVPAPRPADGRAGRSSGPRAFAPGTAAAAGAAAAADATATVPADTAPTAKVGAPPADPTTKLDASPPVADETRVDDAAALDETRVDGPPAVQEPPVEPPRPTSVPAAPVSPAPSAGRAAVIPGTKPERNRRNLLIGAVAALLLIALVVAVWLLNSGDDGGGDEGQPTAATSAAPAPTSAAPSTAAPSSAAPSPTPSATPSPTGFVLPAGWTMYTGSNGFKVPVPPGMKAKVSSSTSVVVYDTTGGKRELFIQWTNRPEKDAVADWHRQEPYRKNIVHQYQYIGIKACDWYRTCADWDWLESRDGARIHVRNRGVATASNRGFALRWEVPVSDWDANLTNWEIITKGFKPDRAN
ncbi:MULTISPECIES: serine/threonine-protein kinase [Micromonospora]|uniref:non-specific serine/threonine protein kinase n=1 Tax=Micromonospora solifontis TaxID=2487138 RepID=A0ABX9WNQ5_9ACTN|nr:MULTISPECIES: serine/threonine-protein kinase [Micromonospora]NES14355.1 protein kinase [Micromonospora sp. PPF5-17B]NES35037.1 protein kinase [Micromonospora solifontis]NES57463.1 protein kinase [Micromonospora sp. PPF5-6]RNM01308.1 serine/threonine protein kinase [Micromonospora solifontis]